MQEFMHHVAECSETEGHPKEHTKCVLLNHHLANRTPHDWRQQDQHQPEGD
jgi:hypothetical protein